jgi:hypothetical protein
MRAASTIVGTPSTEIVAPDGIPSRGWSLDGSSLWHQVLSGAHYDGFYQKDEITVFGMAYANSSGAEARQGFAGTGNQNWTVMQRHFGGGTGVFMYTGSPSLYAVTTSDIFPDDRWFTFSRRHMPSLPTNAERANLWIDGDAVSFTYIGTPANTVVATWAYGNAEGLTGSMAWDGYIAFFTIWLRYLPDAELKELHNNPTALYGNSPARLYEFPAPAAGTTPKGPLGHPLKGAFGGPI